MTADNQTIQSLWIGKHLSNIEMLTIKSFIKHGHSFHLYVYEESETELPEGVILKDANQIISFNNVFCYSNSSMMGHGKGSYAGFSDIFRYKLLFEKGGWWVDMDIVCLKPFDFQSPYFFRDHHSLKLVGSVMKAPAGSTLMKTCYDEAMQQVTHENTDWHKPINILINNVIGLGLENYIVAGAGNLDLWHESTSKFIQRNTAIPESYYFIHWQNEAWRHYGLKKSRIAHYSSLGKLLIHYKLIPAEISLSEKLKNRLYHSSIANNLRMLGAWT